MQFIKKNAFWLSAVGILFLFFVTRLYNILGIPIFTDEAIYIRWSQIAANDANWRFISLTDGKQPMYVWIAMLLMKVIDDPLLAGRVVSVISGFFSMIGMFFLTNELFKHTGSKHLNPRNIGLLASLIYVLYPFSLLYDRMALYDSLVAMFIIWALYFEVLLVRHLRLDLALILGMIVGGGMLTKTNANFALILLPFSLLLFDFKDKEWKKKLLRWVIYAVVAALVANVMYLILRLSPFFHIIGEKNLIFIYSFSEWIQNPFAYVWNNTRALLEWFITYTTIPFIILIISSFFIGKKFLREKLLLLIWFIIPFVALAFFGKTMYPRYLLFMAMPLLALGAYALASLLLVKRIWLKAIICISFFLMFIINNFFIITDFPRSSVPFSDRDQFYGGWPSGVGVKEAVAILQEKAKHEKIYVGTQGNFGLMPAAVEMYLADNPNVTIKGFWPIHDTPPQELVEASKRMPTYVIFYQDCPPCVHVGITPPSWPVTPIFQVEKEQSGRYFTLYEFKLK
jgi:4-amino-4-deoxy-L-arabinose transferase-like glycosyltransferase